METSDYKEWKIQILSSRHEFGVIMTAPSGDTFQQPMISWKSPLSARRYAKAFIDWYLKLEDQHQEHDISVPDREIYKESTTQG